MKKEKKTERLGVRLTPLQKNEIENLASGFGMTMSEFIRDFTIRIITEINNKKNGKQPKN